MLRYKFAKAQFLTIFSFEYFNKRLGKIVLLPYVFVDSNPQPKTPGYISVPSGWCSNN